MADFRVTGADDLARAAKVLRKYGDVGKQGRKELLRSIRDQTKPLRAGLKASARVTLPQRGGLAATVAGSSITARTKTGSRSAGVEIRAVGRRGQVRDIRATDRGRLRHPVFGNRDVWVTQPVTPGWFTKPLDAFAPKVRGEILEAMERVLERVARETRR